MHIYKINPIIYAQSYKHMNLIMDGQKFIPCQNIPLDEKILWYQNIWMWKFWRPSLGLFRENKV